MRRAINADDLLSQWRLRQAAYRRQVAALMESGKRDRDTLLRMQAAVSMELQLSKCIDQLQEVLVEDYPKSDFLNLMIRHLEQKEKDK